jgi:predicted lipoprotein with Yx(FWY)xxD motif
MPSFNKLLIPTAIVASLLLAACGSSSHSSSSSTQAASAYPATSAPASSTASAMSVGTAKGSAGTYLTGPSGKALYIWVADSNGTSACSGACAQAWPPLTAATTPKVSGGANAADITLISRSDGTKQVAYKGRPLYYYVGDTGPGMTNGQGSNQFGAKWWLIGPSGTLITTSSSSAGSPASTTSGGSSGSSWG